MLVQKGSVVPTVASNSTQYEQILHNLQHDTRWMHEVSLGKRVGLYRFASDIGSGNFSHVKLAVHQLTRDKVAIKIIDKSKLDNKTRKMLAREIATMEEVHHPNIIRLFEVVETYSKIHLVTEFASGGELFNKITMEGRLDETIAKKLFLQVLHAIKHMHNKGFIHRDIKAENVFYASPTIVKLGDFGFSTQLQHGMWQPLNTFCGSPPYAAPELFRDDSYIGQLVDIWALGVLLYFMVTASMPFRAHTVVALKNFILDGKYQIPGYVSDSCCYLIEHTLVQVPRRRISINEMIENEWFQKSSLPADRNAHRKNSIMFLANKFRRGSTPSGALTASRPMDSNKKESSLPPRKCSTQLKETDLKDITTKNASIQLNAEEKLTNGDAIKPQTKLKLANANMGQSLDVQKLPSLLPSSNLKRADGSPVELGRFVMLPTCTNNLTFLNPLEVKTREKLQVYGITSQMLCDNIPHNSKSCIIGVYRVVMHRVLTEEYLWDSLNNPESIKTASNKQRQTGKISDKSKNSRKKTKKTCTIL